MQINESAWDVDTCTEGIEFFYGPLDGQRGPPPWSTPGVVAVFAKRGNLFEQSNTPAYFSPGALLHFYLRRPNETFEYVGLVIAQTEGDCIGIRETWREEWLGEWRDGDSGSPRGL